MRSDYKAELFQAMLCNLIGTTITYIGIFLIVPTTFMMLGSDRDNFSGVMLLSLGGLTSGGFVIQKIGKRMEFKALVAQAQAASILEQKNRKKVQAFALKPTQLQERPNSFSKSSPL